MVLIGLGSNLSSRRMDRIGYLKFGLEMMNRAGSHIVCVSKVYESAALGQEDQGAYVNMAALVSTSMSPVALLRKLKTIESQAGRRTLGGRRWTSRVLDIDIIDFKGLICNWDCSKKQAYNVSNGHIILPHAQAHFRPFVLKPIADIIPNWRHPVFKSSVATLLKRAEERAHFSGGSIIREYSS